MLRFLGAAEEAGEDEKIKDNSEYLERCGEFFMTGMFKDDNCSRLAQAMLAQAMAQQSKRKKRPFTLTVNSPGGIYDSGVMLAGTINRIKAMGIPVTIRVTGEACSMGSILLQYGTQRICDSESQIMVHDVTTGMYGQNARIEDYNRNFQNTRQAVARIYASRNTAGHTDPQWWIDNYLNGREHFLTAEQALELGLIDLVELGVPFPPAEETTVAATEGES